MSTIPNNLLTNPFKSLRLHHNYSQREIAEFASVGAQVVLLNEFGCYSHPNPKILKFFETLGELPEVMELEYQVFRDLTRDAALARAANPLNPFLPLSASGNPPHPGFFNINSMQAWNKWKRQFNVSTVGFCKNLCIQPSIITSFENSLYARNWNFIKEWLWP